MTQAKHTPWDFLVNDGEWEVFDASGNTVASNLTEANARLIAAAPAMREALLIVQETLRKRDNSDLLLMVVNVALLEG